MIPVYFPKSASEVAVISALLEAYEIPFFIRGGAFSRIYPGVQIKDFNTQAFMVPPGFWEPARELLAGFNEPAPSPPVPSGAWMRLWAEAFFFGWFVPGSRWIGDEGEE